MNDLPKAYVAKDYEDTIYKRWESSGAFQPNTKSQKKPFVITMPPPNATGTLHLGHAVMLAIEDIMIRFHRMKGCPTLWVPGTDHAGIATQNKVERILKEEEGKTRHEIGREALIKKIKTFVANSQDLIRNQVRKMGSSCDWSREYYSLDDSLNRTVTMTFKKMFADGLIYRGNRIVHWCTRCYSTLSDEEVEYTLKKTKFYYFQYGPFVIGTARPETKFGDHVVIVHPDDDCYKKYHGKKIKIPWIGADIEATVIADEASDMNLGSGVMTITPAHSFVDFDLAKKHGIEVIQMIDEEGKLTDANGPFAGLDATSAREKFVEILEKKGLVVKIDHEYEHNLSVCSRCQTPIQPLVSKQWFIDVNHPVESWDYKNLKLEKGTAYSFKEVMLHVVRENMIEIIPDRFNKTYFQWIENLRDWCISRQLWWGHQIPVYYHKHDNNEIKVQEESPGKEWVRDSDTLDTWFSAGLFTFSPLKWVDDHSDFKKYHPTTVLETGYDIIFFWVARMILMTTYMTGQIPFEKIYLHGLIRTRDGKKMSKSHPETCIDPLDVIKDFGADALRLSLFVGSTPGNDTRLYKEKIAGYRNFVNKLWNVGRYILHGIASPRSPALRGGARHDVVPQTLADAWILSRMQTIIEQTEKYIKAFQFSEAAENLYSFTWNELADWYLEISKIQKTANEALQKNTDQILVYLLETLLKLWHPFTPFVTEQLWSFFKPALLMAEKWPETIVPLKNKNAESSFNLLRTVVITIRNLRAEQKVEPSKKIDALLITQNHQKLFTENQAIVKFLARLEEVQIERTAKAPENTISKVLPELAIHLPLISLIDTEKEKKRLEKERERLDGYVKGLDAKLSNKQFLKNAPDAIVKIEKKKHEEAKKSLENIFHQLKKLP